MTKIEWTEKTWNPIAGCTAKSEGCTNCYAINMARRLDAMGVEKYKDTTRKSGKKYVWTGQINFDDEKALLEPLKRKKPTTYFVNSMSDLFHEAVPFEWVDQIFAVMALCPQHTFQVLTKRPDRMKEYFGQLRHDGTVDDWFGSTIFVYSQMEKIAGTCAVPKFPLNNVWLGTSIEDKKALSRIDVIRDCPAPVTWLSIEPLLEDLGELNLTGIDWVVVGGESGPGSRPMNPNWVWSIQRQCKHTGTPFLFKQWGDWWPLEACIDARSPVFEFDDMFCKSAHGEPPEGLSLMGDPCHIWAEETSDNFLRSYRVGKKAARRLFVDDIHDEYPEVRV